MPCCWEESGSTRPAEFTVSLLSYSDVYLGTLSSPLPFQYTSVLAGLFSLYFSVALVSH